MSFSRVPHSEQQPFSNVEIQAYVRARIPGARLEQNEWRAPCPIHHGKRLSFALNATTGLWICHSECSASGNLIQLEMRLSGLEYAEAREEIMSLTNGHSNNYTVKTIDAVYPYTDENGRLLYESVRWQPKEFSLRRPDGMGGHIRNIQGVRRVLYRLPKVMESPVIFLVEGEKDVHTMEALGFVATTNAMGAGHWYSEYSQSLRGKDVVIIPDRDEKGWQHAAKVESMLSGFASRVRVIELPLGKDVTEWVEQGGTQEQLVELLEHLIEEPKQKQQKQQKQQRQQEEQEEFRVFTYRDVPSVWDLEACISWVIEGLIFEHGVTMITGDSGHGKTVFATAIAGHIAHGRSFLGRETKQRKVLYMDRENPLSIVKQHLFDLSIERTDNLVIWGDWCQSGADSPTAPSLIEFAQEEPVIIFDSLIAFHSGDEQSATDTRKYLHQYRRLAAKGATVIVLHHVGKGESSKWFRGSSDIKANVDMAWLLEKLGDPAGILQDLRLVPFKDRTPRGGSPLPLMFRDGLFTTAHERPESSFELLEKIVKNHPGEGQRSLISLGRLSGISKQRVIDLLKDGLDTGLYELRKLGPQRYGYFLRGIEVEL